LRNVQARVRLWSLLLAIVLVAAQISLPAPAEARSRHRHVAQRQAGTRHAAPRHTGKRHTNTRSAGKRHAKPRHTGKRHGKSRQRRGGKQNLSLRALREARAIAVRSQHPGQAIASTALAFRGTPYSRGGLSSRGMDCSGLVVRTLALRGIANAPHNSAALYRLGTKVSYAAMQPGDVLFFNCHGRGISHVGIYIGNNRFVHASSKSGVRVDAIAGYYKPRLVGARRIR
jgi:cell wall-associated NlpC family hydrolase